MQNQQAHSARLATLTCIALGALAMSLMGGCSSIHDVTGSIAAPTQTVPRSDADRRAYTREWGNRYTANPSDMGVAMNYAKGLKSLGRYGQAASVLQVAVMHNPKDLDLRAEYGKALVDSGDLVQASAVLNNAQTPDHLNWSVLSAQGTIADQTGDHNHAQYLYHQALQINPNEPSVLSNLGLSYALSKNLPQAEQVLAQAANDPRADSRIRQNYALVLSLEGKFNQAEQVSARDLPPSEAAANVTAIRQMIAQSNTWRDIQNARPTHQTRHKKG